MGRGDGEGSSPARRPAVERCGPVCARGRVRSRRDERERAESERGQRDVDGGRDRDVIA